MRRLIDGPERDWLGAREAAEWLGIGLTLFRELLAAGELPRPVAFGRRKAQRWYWLDLVSWSHLRAIDRDRRDAPAAAGQRRRPEG